MPDEAVLDLSGPHPQPIQRRMSDADAADLAVAQAVAQSAKTADDTRQQQIRSTLIAYLQNATPTGAETVQALRALIRAVARDQA